MNLVAKVCAFSLLFLACTQCSRKAVVSVDLPPLPEALTAELARAKDFIQSGEVKVPRLFEPRKWSLVETGRRSLALIERGIKNGALNKEEFGLLNELADYMLAFQYEEDEDFLLPGAALALVGILQSEPENPDHRYRYGLSRMWYPWPGYDSAPEIYRQLVGYMLEAAAAGGLPLLPEVLEYYHQRGEAAPPGVKTFDMAAGDRSFMRGLNLPGNRGRDLEAALEAGDLNQARRVVAGYYAEKMCAFSLSVKLNQSQLEEAEDLLKNIFILRAHMVRRHDFGQTVDWATVLDNDIESNVSINNHPHFLLLARAWKQTGEIRFRDHLIELLSSWFEQSPRPNIGQGALQWRTLEVGARAATRWPQIMSLGSVDSLFVARMFYPLVYFLFQHADYLMVHNMRHLSNWGQVESAGLLSASLILSEHENSDLYRETALRRFDYLNQEMYFPDGVHTENSFYYHSFPLGTQAEVFKLARSMGIDLDTAWSGVLERGIEALVWSALPDGSILMVSDVGPRKSYIGSWQKLGRSLFPDNPMFIFPVGVSQYPGPPPEKTSYFFPYAGYGIMRENWTPQAQYLLFDMGFYGTNHQHEDKLNIILYAYGRELLHDPGIYRYSRDNFERYFRSSRGHNLVLLDGKGQRRDMFFDKEEPYRGLAFPDADSRWIERKTHILAEGAYRQGFALKIHPLWYGGPRPEEKASLLAARHIRKILWIKGEYWVMLDHLIGQGSHRLEQVFHFSPVLKSHSAEDVDPGKVVLRSNRIAFSSNPGVANLAVIQVGTDDLRPRKEKGKKDPHVGWTSLYGENPAWDVTFEVERSLPTTLVTVLYPMKPGQDTYPEVKVIRKDKLAAVFDLVFQGRTDRVVLATGKYGAKVEFPGGSFEGEALLLQKTGEGRFEPVLAEGQKSLHLKRPR